MYSCCYLATLFFILQNFAGYSIGDFNFIFSEVQCTTKFLEEIYWENSSRIGRIFANNKVVLLLSPFSLRFWKHRLHNKIIFIRRGGNVFFFWRDPPGPMCNYQLLFPVMPSNFPFKSGFPFLLALFQGNKTTLRIYV